MNQGKDPGEEGSDKKSRDSGRPAQKEHLSGPLQGRFARQTGFDPSENKQGQAGKEKGPGKSRSDLGE